MATQTPMIRAAILDGYEAFLAGNGIALEPLLKEVGLRPAQVADTDGEISLNKFALLLHVAAERLDRPSLAYEWATAYVSGGSGVFGYLLMHSPSVRHALQDITRYVGLLLHPVETRYEEEDHHGILSWRFPESITAPRMQYASFAMAATTIRLRSLAGANWHPLQVDLEHRGLDCKPWVERVLGRNVHFNKEWNAIHVQWDALEKSSPNADRRLFKLIKDLAERYLAERVTEPDDVLATRQAIMKGLSAGNVSRARVAAGMNVSPSGLQARLTKAGTTYEAILQDVRSHMSDRYLRETDLPLTEVAFLLGYSELSAYTRAIQRWQAVSPSRRRRELRGLQAKQ